MANTPTDDNGLHDSSLRPLMTCQPPVIQALWALHEHDLVTLDDSGWNMRARTHAGGQARLPAGTWTFARRGHGHWSSLSLGITIGDVCFVWQSDGLPDQTTPVVDEVALEDEPTVNTLEALLQEALGAPLRIDFEDGPGGWTAVLIETVLGPHYPQAPSPAAPTIVEARGRLVADALIALARQYVSKTLALNAGS